MIQEKFQPEKALKMKKFRIVMEEIAKTKIAEAQEDIKLKKIIAETMSKNLTKLWKK